MPRGQNSLPSYKRRRIRASSATNTRSLPASSVSHRKQIPASEKSTRFLANKRKRRKRNERGREEEKEKGTKWRRNCDRDGKKASVGKRAVAVIVVFPRGKVSGRRKYETSVYILPEYKTSRPLARSAWTRKPLKLGCGRHRVEKRR